MNNDDDFEFEFDDDDLGDVWLLCEPCFNHLSKHYDSDPNPPWQDGIQLIENQKEKCRISAGCLECGESHENILRGSPPDDPCDSEFMKDISS